MPDPIDWSKSLAQMLQITKQTLASAPALGLPDYRKPFNLFIHEKLDVASGVLTLPFGPAH